MLLRKQHSIPRIIFGFLFTIALFATPAFAELKLSIFDKYTYNIGDKLLVKGEASAGNATSATLLLSLNCAGGETTGLGAKTIYFESSNIGSNKTQEFDFPVVLGKEALGGCRVVAVLAHSTGHGEGNITLQNALSEEFRITKDISGEFIIDQTNLQSGQNILIKGTLKKMDSTPINGLAKLYFKQNDLNYLIDAVQIANGQFSYSFDSSKSPPGEYSVLVEANDLYGNEIAQNAGTFEISNKITVSVELNNKIFLPKEKILINGTAYPEMQFELKDADVFITLDNALFKTTLAKNSFAYTLQIPQNIHSGDHTLFITVRDKFNNEGKTTASFTITPIATLILTELNTKTALPGDHIIAIPYLYDQANELMEEKGLLYVLPPAPEKKPLFNTTTSFGKPAEFNIPRMAAPGQYTVRTVSGSIIGEETFTVQALESLSLKFLAANNSVIAENLGNIDYKRAVSFKAVDASGNVVEIQKRIKIAPGEKREILLEQELPSGLYSIVLPRTFAQEEQIFYNASVTDKRTAFKKVSDGLSPITGYFIATNPSGSNPQIILIIGGVVFVIIVILTVYFRRAGQGHYDHSEGEEREEQNAKRSAGSDDDSKTREHAEGYAEYAKDQTEIVKEYVTADKKGKNSKNAAGPEDPDKEEEAEKTDDPILKRFLEKKKRREQMAKNMPLRDDPQVKRYVSDTLKRALPEAERAETVHGQPEQGQGTSARINTNLETKIKIEERD